MHSLAWSSHLSGLRSVGGLNVSLDRAIEGSEKTLSERGRSGGIGSPAVFVTSGPTQVSLKNQSLSGSHLAT